MSKHGPWQARLGHALLCAVLVCLGLPGFAWGAAGQPDPGFGSSGQVSGGHGALGPVAVDDQGRILTPGWGYTPNAGDAVVVKRYLSDGSADSAFGDHGQAAVETIPADAQQGAFAVAVAQTPDGGIIVAYQLSGSGR